MQFNAHGVHDPEVKAFILKIAAADVTPLELRQLTAKLRAMKALKDQEQIQLEQMATWRGRSQGLDR